MEEKQIILYSTGCPKCQVLTKKLNAAGVKYEVKTDVDEMLSLGIKSAPVLSVGGNLMDFSKAVQWVSTCNGE